MTSHHTPNQKITAWESRATVFKQSPNRTGGPTRTDHLNNPAKALGDGVAARDAWKVVEVAARLPVSNQNRPPAFQVVEIQILAFHRV